MVLSHNIIITLHWTFTIVVLPTSVTLTMDGGDEDTILVSDRVVLYCNIKLSGVMRSLRYCL